MNGKACRRQSNLPSLKVLPLPFSFPASPRCSPKAPSPDYPTYLNTRSHINYVLLLSVSEYGLLVVLCDSCVLRCERGVFSEVLYFCTVLTTCTVLHHLQEMQNVCTTKLTHRKRLSTNKNKYRLNIGIEISCSGEKRSEVWLGLI